MTSVFLSHPSSLEHDTGAHPERAARIQAVERELAAHDWLGFERMLSPAVDHEVLLAVHPASYIAAVEELSLAGGGAFDLDTVVSSGSYEAALHAAGGAVRAVELVLDRRAAFAFSAHRPPGHHATRTRAMGFCLFNSVAVAAQFALDRRGLDRVMVLDWDVHHGNGTNDIFHTSDQVLFVSIHQSPLYPGTGPASDVGSGPGTGFTVNLPVPAGSGNEVFRSMVDHVALPMLRDFQPQLVLVSAGYDAHASDPLGECRVTETGFAAMTRAVRDACAEAEAALVFVLEGGYGLGGLSRSVAATMSELREDERGRALDDVPITPLAHAAAARLAERWPVLAR